MDELDPEIAALLDNVEQIDDLPALDDKTQFKKKTLFEVSEEDLLIKKKQSIHEVNLTQKEFEEITEFTNPTPNPVFDDTSYYKTALTGENECSVYSRVHSEFISCFQNI